MDEHTDTEPCVIGPGIRPHGLDAPITKGFAQTSLLTTCRTDSPSPDQAAALAIIGAHDIDAKHTEEKTLVTEVVCYDLELMRGHVDGEADDYGPVTGDHNIFSNCIAMTLEHQGYVIATQHGIRRYPELTEERRQTFRTFRRRAEPVVSGLGVWTDGLSRSADFTFGNPVGAPVENR